MAHSLIEYYFFLSSTMLLLGGSSFFQVGSTMFLLLSSSWTRQRIRGTPRRFFAAAGGRSSHPPPPPPHGDLISSTKSGTIKKIQALLTKRKKRVELGQVVVEGPRMVLDLWQNAQTRHLVRQVVLDQAKWEAYAGHFLPNNDDKEQ